MKSSVVMVSLSSLAVLELILFLFFYFSGEHGYKKIKLLQSQHTVLESNVTDARRELVELEKRVHDFKTYPYYKEKIIREQLQMIKPNEVIYKKS